MSAAAMLETVFGPQESQGARASTVEARVPPNDLDAEAAVLSVAMNGPSHMPRLSAMLSRQDFYSEAHGWIFEACVDLHRAGQPVDAVTVSTWLRDHDRLAQVGGVAYITTVLNAAPALSGVVKYANTVRSKAKVRATILAAQRITAKGYAGGQDDAAYLAESASAIQAATRLPSAEALTSNAEALAAIVKRIERAHKLGTMVTGIPTGLDRYDRMTLGLHAKQLTIVAARPGQGKTSLGANIGANVARAGVGVLFFSLEMSREEVIERQLSSTARIDGTLLKTGLLSPVQWTALHNAAQAIHTMPFWIDERTGLTVADIANVAMGAIDEAKARKTALGLIIIDYLQKIAIRDDGKRKQRYEIVGDVAKGLKQLARDTGLPVIALAQLRRLGKSEGKRRPTMDDLRESGDIEQEADNIVLVNTADDDEDGRPGAGIGNVKELIIEKARGGRTGTVRVRWTPELTLFDNLPDEGDWAGDSNG